jgi:hypothetical protein
MSFFIGAIFVALALAAFFVEMFLLPPPPGHGMFRSTQPLDGMFRPPPPGC